MIGDEKSRRRRYFAGIVLLLGAAVFWSLSGALIKLTYQGGQGPSAVTIAFYRSLFAGLFLLPLARRKLHTLKASAERRRPDRGYKKGSSSTTPRWLFFRRYSPLAFRPAALSCVVFFTLMTLCFVLATTKTEAANAIILQYTSTFWVFGLSPLVLGEKPRRDDLWLLGVAMIGIGIIFVGQAPTDLIGLLIALAAGLSYGLETLMIRRMRDSDSAAVIVLNSLGSAVLLLPVVLLTGHGMVSATGWGLLIAMGVVQFGLPYYLYARALVHVPAHHAALITLAEPVINPVWTYLAVGERVPMATLIGGSVILASLLLFLRAAKRAADRSLPLPPPVARGEPTEI